MTKLIKIASITYLLLVNSLVFSQNNIMIIDYNNNYSSDQQNNASIIYNRLLATQASVVRVNAIPATINPATYNQVWLFGNMGAASNAPIVNYINNGGAVYVQSEISCCNAAAAFVDQLINSTTISGGAITHSTMTLGKYQLQADTSLFCNLIEYGNAARLFTGVPANNILFAANNTCGVSGAPTTGDVIGVKFASCDMISGQGALISTGDFDIFPSSTACAQTPLLGSPNNNLIIDFIANLLTSLTTCSVLSPDTAQINYQQTTFCITDLNPIPIITGTTGGLFTIDNGGVINATTGEINLISSGAASFNVTYSSNGVCPDTTVNITINICSFCDTICGPNLAPNPGFENTTVNCSDTVSEMFTNYSQVQGWYGIACDTCSGNGSTPDYNNTNCSGPAQTNTCDASNGSVGFFSFALIGSDAREYVQAQLTPPLTAGTTYCVSVEAKSATGSTAYERNDGLGIWFTNQKVDIDLQNGGQQFIGPGSLINATPQVENPSGNIIDTVCQTISGTFTANGTEQWLVIGNFRNDVSTNSAGDCSFLCVGYMNIDNISIRESCNTTPLPIELNSFDVTCYNNFPQIKWTTSSEINNDYFTIEKSFDAINWEIVTYIQGAGNSNQQINYSYIDDSYENNNQTIYYRLKQTDFDGNFEYFNIIPIKCNGLDNSFVIFPNPAINNITITGNEITKIEIIDVLGRIVKQVEPVGNNIEIDISSISSGTYVVKIYDSNKISNQKIIKQ